MKLKLCFIFSFITLFNLNSLRAQSSGSIVELIRAGKTEEAKKIISTLDKEKYTPDLIIFLNGLLSRNGEEAVKLYSDLIKNYPKSSYCDDALLRIAQYKYALALYNQAKDAFIDIIKKYPNTNLKAKCLFGAGLSYYALGKKDLAKSQFSVILKHYSNSEIALSAKEQLQLISGTKQTEDSSKTQLIPAYSIQVGAFTRQQNAILRKSFFEKKGYQVELRTKIKENTRFYLVWIGAFSLKDEARLFGEKLKKKFGLKYTLVTR